ncbi:MAG: hypothetical protein OXH14_04850, partial [Alphaproteobacteria bacterium]|nr:hypothetical protein [Alphaproteobacteria bacterium]
MRLRNTNRLPRLCHLIIGLLLLGWPLYGAESGAPAVLRVDAERLQERIERMARIGGSPQGVTRLAFSEADLRGRAQVTRLMQEAGLEVR